MHDIVKTLGLLALGATAGTATAEAVNYKLDPSHSVVAFEVKHNGMSTSRGLIRAKDGTVVLDRQARTGKVDVVMDMATMTTAVPSQVKSLLGADLFNVATHPTARFEADNIGFDGDKVASVAGRLTLNGQTQPVTLKATSFSCAPHPFAKREACGGDFETTIQRSRFGLNQMMQFASDEVRLQLQVEGIRPE